MPQRHAKLIEVALCQIGQDFSIDLALAKRGLILTETEAAQPSPDIHDCIRPAGINDGLIERACPGIGLRRIAVVPGSSFECQETAQLRRSRPRYHPAWPTDAHEFLAASPSLNVN